MSSVQTVSPNADVIGKANTLMMNISAGKGLQNVLKTNLGPKGTIKMLVSGAGAVKLTKDGKVLLDEMQIAHATAAIIARTATAQDDITGDGTTSNVLFTGELLKQAERHLIENVHPRVIVEGFEIAREYTLAFLDYYKKQVLPSEITREQLVQVARTSLRTKLSEELADHLTEIVVNAVQTIRKDPKNQGDSVDLHMVELMHMRHQSALDSKFIDGLVLDHGTRHPDMAKVSNNCFIFACNVSLEYEKSTVGASFVYTNAGERDKLVNAERKFTDDKVRQVIAFKESVCKNGEAFILINMKGIDPISLDMLNKAGIVGIRRAKRRNMERIPKACGGYSVNSLDDVKADCLGKAKTVYEHVLGDDKYTFIEGTQNASSCTILIRGPNDHTIAQMKDAVRDGLRAVANVLEDKGMVPGAGAFELAAHLFLTQQVKPLVQGRAKLGVQAFADALLVVPKTLAENSGLDVQATLLDLVDEAAKQQDLKVVVQPKTAAAAAAAAGSGKDVKADVKADAKGEDKENPIPETSRITVSGKASRIGIDLETGKAIVPEKTGVWDNFRVKKQLLHLGSLMAMKLLLVDEVIRAGRKMGNKG